MSSADFDVGPPLSVSCAREGMRSTLIFVRTFRHPIEQIWSALTDPAQLRQWAPFVPDRDLSAEGPVTINMTDGGPEGDVPSIVVRAVSPSHLDYTWGDDRLVWTLEATDGGIRLTLRHTVDSDDWVPKVAAGWHISLAVADRLLEGRPVGRIVGSDAKTYGWERLHDAYASALGIEGTGWPSGD